MSIILCLNRYTTFHATAELLPQLSLESLKGRFQHGIAKQIAVAKHNCINLVRKAMSDAGGVGSVSECNLPFENE